MKNRVIVAFFCTVIGQGIGIMYGASWGGNEAQNMHNMARRLHDSTQSHGQSRGTSTKSSVSKKSSKSAKTCNNHSKISQKEFLQAVHSGNVSRVKELIVCRNAQVNKAAKWDKDRPAQTPLAIAIRTADKNMVDMLLTHGAHATARSLALALEFLPLTQIGTHKDKVAIVKMLLVHGAPVNKKLHGVTPLFQAAQSGSEEVVKALLAHGAKVDQGGPNKQTPLMVSASEGHVDVVQTLLAHGAQVGLKNNFHDTALNIAERQLKNLKKQLKNLKHLENDKRFKKHAGASAVSRLTNIIAGLNQVVKILKSANK